MSLQHPSSQVPIFDAVKALAFVGDLSMGQPVDHSARTAWLAAHIAEALGLDVTVQSSASYVALLRWSGCTANATEIADLVGDDVGGRNMILTQGLPPRIAGSMGLVAQIQCEVSGDVARTLGMPAAIETALRRIFDNLKGVGGHGEHGEAEIPVEVFIVAAASDLEIYSRVYDLARALSLIASRSGTRYPSHLVDAIQRHATDWLHTLEQDPSCVEAAPAALIPNSMAPLELIADVIDLKLPWMTGFSRRVAELAVACSQQLGLDEAVQGRIRRAALIHGMGRASVPNAIWNELRAVTESNLERLRLVPYWTARAGRRIPILESEAELASFADERLDGSGFFRGATGGAISLEARVLGAAAHCVMLQTDRPGRSATSIDGARQALQREAELGRLDEAVVAALNGSPAPPVARAAASVLTEREIAVLSRISHGDSNKEAARALGISPSTVRTHLENIFRKLDCTTRAAATLKAMTTGLL